MKTHSPTVFWIIASMDVTAGLLVCSALLSVAGGLPSIASVGQPLVDGIWFTLNLGGPLVLLAGGLKMLFQQFRSSVFILVFACSIGTLGIVRLLVTGFQILLPGWVLMVLCIGGLLHALKRPWIWATAGTMWCVLILGVWSVAGIVSFVSTETQELSLFLPLQVVGFVLVLVLLFFHLRLRADFLERGHIA